MLRFTKQILINIKDEICAQITKVPKVVKKDVPYICQYASPKDVESFKRRKKSPANDPNWEKSGASSPQEYEKWTHALCGMAVTAMIIKYFKKRNVKLITLARDALSHGVYYYEPSGIISNMQYREFIKWIKKYDLRAEVVLFLSLKRIKLTLVNNKFPIVSVNPNIRGHQTSSFQRKGGHLVLITGYDSNRHILYLHNPSGFSSLKTQRHHEISEKEFHTFYAKRGILVSSEK